MSKKTLDIAGITNELEGASLYFNPPASPVPINPKPSGDPSQGFEQSPAFTKANENDTLNQHASTRASKHEDMHASEDAQLNDGMHDSMPSSQQAGSLENKGGDPSSTHERMHANNQDDLIETIRKSVKKVGREELYVRLPPEEKNELRTVVYQLNELYRGKGGKTSENEVSRIALKLLLEDYKKNGENSILFSVEEALHA